MKIILKKDDQSISIKTVSYFIERENNIKEYIGANAPL